MTVDPTSSLGADVCEEDAPQCDTCSEPIVNKPTHRVITWIEDNTTKTSHFCDDVCLSPEATSE
ncbi:DUF7576 family protein [Halocatena marina]|uniref:DUF7576 family protein n=1 Tax=Halocatena marina TaxID=2934937 RepID=UPI00200FF663|nr:hypothetical protein [Halocatena marina]